MREKNTSDHETQGALRIMEAFSGVDEELVQRSETRRRPYWIYARAAAACLALAVVGTVSWKALHMNPASEGTPDSAPEINGFENAAAYSLQDGEDDQTVGGDSRTTSLAGGASGNLAESSEEDMTDDFAAPKDHTLENEPETNESVRSDEQQEVGATGNGKNKQSSEIEKDENVMIDECGVPTDPRKEISQEEAGNTAVFGPYLPENLPRGYAFENAWSSEDGLTVSWTRGMDYIMISVSAVVPEDVVTADPDKPETYDERLYEIPYAETVPKEYHEVFQDPVFAAEDLSLEVVSSRMKSVKDAGDTNTPRGMFSVLYPEGILVRFNGRGTAEEIWDMFCSVNR